MSSYQNTTIFNICCRPVCVTRLNWATLPVGRSMSPLLLLAHMEYQPSHLPLKLQYMVVRWYTGCGMLWLHCTVDTKFSYLHTQTNPHTHCKPAYIEACLLPHFCVSLITMLKGVVRPHLVFIRCIYFCNVDLFRGKIPLSSECKKHNISGDWGGH